MKKRTTNKYEQKKYKIEESMNNLTKGDYNLVKQIIPGLIGKCANTLNNYSNIPISSKEEIPYSVAIILEDFYGLGPRGICNIEIKALHYTELIKSKRFPKPKN